VMQNGTIQSPTACSSLGCVTDLGMVALSVNGQ
jgi:hypothetical protein